MDNGTKETKGYKPAQAAHDECVAFSALSSEHGVPLQMVVDETAPTAHGTDETDPKKTRAHLGRGFGCLYW